MKKLILLCLLMCVAMGAQAGKVKCKNCNGYGHFRYNGGYTLDSHNYKNCPHCGNYVDMFNHMCECKVCGGVGLVEETPSPRSHHERATSAPSTNNEQYDPIPITPIPVHSDNSLDVDVLGTSMQKRLAEMYKKVNLCLQNNCVYVWGPCNFCKATGICPTCQGKGYIPGNGFIGALPCGNCGGGKICFVCRGQKETDNGYRMDQSARKVLELWMIAYQYVIRIYA